jgi:hypothetical protein
MDEDQIAAELAQRTEEPVPPLEAPTPKPQVPEDEAFHNNLPLETVLDKMKLEDYFEIPQALRREANVETQLNRIMEWAAQEAGSREYTDILRVINDQERIMGNKLKDNRMMRLFQFVTINAQRKRLAQQERALYV